MSNYYDRLWVKAAKILGIDVAVLKKGITVLKQMDLIKEVEDEENLLDLGKDAPLRMTREKLIRLALYDSLTGLPNAYLFKDRLSYHINLRKRDNKSFAVLFIDLDNFKSVNDRFTHAVGDKILQEIASILKNSVRCNDVVARLHGDEFVIMLDDVSDGDDVANTIAKKILSKIANTKYNKKVLGISASIGISYYHKDCTSIENLIMAADTAMYASKKNGKNASSVASQNNNNPEKNENTCLHETSSE